MTQLKRIANRFRGAVRRLVGSPTFADPRPRLDEHTRTLQDIIPALQEQQALTPSLDHRLRVMEDEMPALLNVISSTNGTHRLLRRDLDGLAAGLTALQEAALPALHARIDELAARTEMVRAEALFEIRYASPQAPREQAPARIIDEARVAAARSGDLRLNLGCGHVPLDGYINVDQREIPGVEVVAGLDQLPFEAGEVDEIFSSHVLEHFPEEQLRRALLPYWAVLLRPGGEFRAVVPDADAMLAAFAAGTISYDDLREVTFGGQEYEGDFHFNMYTPETMSDLLASVGFVDIRVEDRGRRNGLCLEFQIAARRPSS